jgi:hypothetical protein
VFFQDAFRRNTPRNHGGLDDLAFRKLRTRRHTAAHDRPAKQALAPEPKGFIDTPRDILARAEHEQ